MIIKINDIEVESNACEKLLGKKIDSKLNFKDHLDGVIKKASRKVNVLSHITHCVKSVSIRCNSGP